MRVLGAELGPPEKDLAGGAALYRHGAGKLMVVDRSDPSNLLPAKQGVGLARKIGADIALACVVLGVIRSHWIHCTDADVHLPLDYFEQSDRAASSQDRTDTTAWIYRFHHRLEGSARQRRAIADYEASLRYYVLGLRFSKSLMPSIPSAARSRFEPMRMPKYADSHGGTRRKTSTCSTSSRRWDRSGHWAEIPSNSRDALRIECPSELGPQSGERSPSTGPIRHFRPMTPEHSLTCARGFAPSTFSASLSVGGIHWSNLSALRSKP